MWASTGPGPRKPRWRASVRTSMTGSTGPGVWLRPVTCGASGVAGFGCLGGDIGEQDDAAMRILTLGDGLHAGDLVHGVVHDLAVCGVHRLQRPLRSGCADIGRDLAGEPLQRLAAPHPIAGHV